MLFTKKVAATVVTQRRQENVIPDGADRFEADVEQSSTAIQVNLHKKLFLFLLRSRFSLDGLFMTMMNGL